jgi:septum formation protein
LILASASPRRAELLRAAGYTFEVVVADVDESIRAGETPATYVRRLAAEKSSAALKRCAVEHAALKGCATDPAEDGATELAALKRCATSEPAAVPPPPHVAQGFSPADLVVLGADTTVVIDGEILGKPRDAADGRRMLQRLSGATHQVLTGVSLRQGAYEVGRVETTAVTFRALTDEDISWYAASGEGLDKAGGYAIQGLASRFIPRIAGSYANVVGLPVESVHELLRSLLASGR